MELYWITQWYSRLCPQYKQWPRPPSGGCYKRSHYAHNTISAALKELHRCSGKNSLKFPREVSRDLMWEAKDAAQVFKSLSCPVLGVQQRVSVACLNHAD